MDDDKKEYSDEMRGSLWADDARSNDKAPIATGTITISGLELRVAMWPARVAGGTGKGAGKKYWPLTVEYRQGTRFVLAKIAPENIVASGAFAPAVNSQTDEAQKPKAVAPVDDMPF